ncbi:efflux RND transporter periplasmic adaptor subunit [Limobrevibacterium gyesilva]|uniref:Efflux RND transporter periplasmic adaptor subunit n=1 Tax=Limobrevibacterium gyesilva TaxID=2991712 RepID=A0AA42CF42_9PROT|nr:efflux RND transporter periplasmic adaptor subunit [Limobrevibacterium gyesilva]MCW3476089.1 efflux RND transporter periplasmic adaptor subunit [Limobrevibacterium gyesilva]
MTSIAPPPASALSLPSTRTRSALGSVLSLGMLLLVAGSAIAQTAAPAAAPPAPTGVPVSVAPVMRRDVPVLLRNIGAVQAFQSVLIRARVDGTLEKVFFQEGQDVKRGDPIAQIDPRPYQAVYDQAVAKKASDEATLLNARLDLKRSSELARSQFASQQTVDTGVAKVAQLEAQVKADDAAIAAAKVNLDYTNITSPIDGRVGLRLLDPGNVIRFADTSGVGIVTIAQIHPIAVTFTLPQDALPKIQAAMAKGKLPAYAYTADDKTMLGQGELLTTDNMIDATTGTIKLKAVFPNADNKLWPGQFVNVRLQLETLRGALAVASVGVQRGPGGLFVYLVKPDSTVAMQPVEIGQDDGQVVVVTKGLEEGAQIVVNGQSRLQNGSRIVVAQANSNS